MLTGEIRNQIDSIWNTFWTGGISNPLEVIEQITYLLFIKRLDDLHTLEEAKATRLEVQKALAFDWSPFVGTQQANSPRIPAGDLDEDELAPRAKSVVARIIRDTKIIRELKALHNHTCQLCGKRLQLSPGVFYSEAHHLKPLGRPHLGPDKKPNMVCVCPNCHVKLDFHAVRIEPAKLRTVAGHSVAQRFIDHHNKLC